MKTLRVLLAICLLSGGAATAQAEIGFSRPLSVGATGSDVLLLQQLLNRDPDSRIATTGPGSPGQETLYFGLKTAKAVSRFQEKYTDEVLRPAGLKTGTGAVGPLTRAKLTQLLKAQSSQPSSSAQAPATPPAPPTSLPTVTPAAAAPAITSISPSRGGPGTMVTITGAGFDAISNTIYTGYGEFVRGSVSPNVIQIEIQPDFGKFQNGPVEFPFWIYLENKNGASNAKIFTFIAP